MKNLTIRKWSLINQCCYPFRAAIILRVQQEDASNNIRAAAAANLHTANHRHTSNHSTGSSSAKVPRLKMTRVHIPFTFKLVEKANTSYEGKG